MTPSVYHSKILFISTYPPVKCGIASFTEDLVNAITGEVNIHHAVTICALDKKEHATIYPPEVSLVMNSYDLDSCIETAAIINRDPGIKMVCIEHEFGLYGGEYGEYLLGFLALLEKPFIIRFHTVLPAPDVKRLKIVKTIGLLADRVIVMTQNSARLLEQDYQMDAGKMIIIPHGTHANSTIDAQTLKVKYNLDNRLVLTTFGLLSPNKGIEKGILAMANIANHFPQAMYIVLGNTHPNLLKQDGEKYRDYLQQLIQENNLQDNVRLVNEYVPTEKLMEYLALTDIYLFTSKDPNQAISGTFLYAMSAGCAVISNSFVLAKEMLDEKTGIIIEGSREDALAENAIRLLQDRQLRKQMGHNAFVRTRDTPWPKVAQRHADLFREILGNPVSAPSFATQFIRNR